MLAEKGTMHNNTSLLNVLEYCTAPASDMVFFPKVQGMRLPTSHTNFKISHLFEDLSLVFPEALTTCASLAPATTYLLMPSGDTML